MAGTVKLTEKAQAEVKGNASFVVTQPETIDGIEKEAVRRVPLANVKEALIGKELASLEAGQLETVEELLGHQRELHRLKCETGTAVLTNSLAYPFQGVAVTIALREERDRTDYMVAADLLETAGGPVSSIEVTDRLVNGFKLAYKGSAATAKIRYYVIGGYN